MISIPVLISDMIIPLPLIRNEPLHDKTNKMTCAPSKDADQPGHPQKEALGP